MGVGRMLMEIARPICFVIGAGLDAVSMADLRVKPEAILIIDIRPRSGLSGEDAVRDAASGDDGLSCECSPSAASLF